MANAQVEKLKEMGLKHGEKAVVTIVGVICLVLFYAAWTHPVIEMTPEEVQTAAQQASTHINEHQDEDKILATIQDQGIKLQGFEEIVDNRKPGNMDPTEFRLPTLMAAREPGAGLLREAPSLIAVADLRGHPGRGAINVFAIDETTGQIIMEKPKKDEPRKKGRRRRRGGSSSMGSGMAMGGSGGGGGKEKSEIEKQEEKAKQEAERKRTLGQFAPGGGNRDVADVVEENPEEQQSTEGLVPKEILKGYRWIALTGVLDNNRFRENFAKALKIDLAGAYPNYLRLELQRQERLSDGEWSEWQEVDRQEIQKEVFDVITEEDEEATKKGVPLVEDKHKLDALVDPLPFLQVGYWSGVQPLELVNPEAIKELLTKPKEEETNQNDMMMNSGMMGSGMMDAGMMPGAAEMPPMMPGMMGSGSEFGSMFGGPTGSEIDTNFPKSDADKLMVRLIDFLVEPDATYRYRVRTVVANPNFNSSSVMPGVDIDSRELAGPWSDPTDPIHVPPDVATYVVDFAPSAADLLRDDLVQFQIVRWEPENGLTIVRRLSSAPGEVIGEKIDSEVPDLKNKKRIRQNVDFTSHRLLVDASGGSRPISNLRLGLRRPQFDAPAQALILRADGSLVLRDQAGDANDGEMEEMKAIYEQELEDAKEDKEKDSSTMMGSGMMGSGGMPR